MTPPPYVPKMGEVYRWVAYEYAAIVLFVLVWLSEGISPYKTPSVFLMSMPVFLVLGFAGGIVVTTFATFGIKNTTGSERRSFVLCLLVSLPGPVGIIASIFAQSMVS